MKIPFVDLSSQYKSLKSEIMPRIEKVFDETAFILGKEVEEFEKSFATFVHAKYCVGVASGTDALHLAVRACDFTEGSEVLVPANTFIATAIGVYSANLVPVPVDVNPDTFHMDPEKIIAKITKKTVAIIPVHLFGRMVDMRPIMEIAKKYNLKVIEDAAQSHGAHMGDQYSGAVGELGCFSFYPGKNLGAYGDGGAITTNSQELYEKLIAIRNYGSPKKYHHPIMGFNSRLDTVQAAILNVKLKHLNTMNELRYKAATKYDEVLQRLGDLVLPKIPPKGEHIFHLYVLRTKHRDALLKYLNDKGVGAGIHYPTPIHLHGAFKYLGYKVGDYPVAENLANEIVSLPIFPELSDEQIQYVGKTIKEFFNNI